MYVYIYVYISLSPPTASFLSSLSGCLSLCHLLFSLSIRPSYTCLPMRRVTPDVANALSAMLGGGPSGGADGGKGDSSQTKQVRPAGTQYYQNFLTGLAQEVRNQAQKQQLAYLVRVCSRLDERMGEWAGGQLTDT